MYQLYGYYGLYPDVKLDFEKLQIIEFIFIMKEFETLAI